MTPADNMLFRPASHWGRAGGRVWKKQVEPAHHQSQSCQEVQDTLTADGAMYLSLSLCFVGDWATRDQIGCQGASSEMSHMASPRRRKTNGISSLLLISDPGYLHGG